MEWTERMNAAIDYIEENLAGEIDLTIAASKAFCSEYLFTRIFSFISDIPLNEYIRLRRLTLAGFLLQRSNTNIVDIANKYNYSSPNSFTRAFQAMHGILPSQARDVCIELKSHPRLIFTSSEEAITELNPQIFEEREITVFGKSLITKASEAYETVPAFWDKCEEEQITNLIVKASNGNETTLLKAVISDIDDDTLKYMICLDMPKCGVSEYFETLTIPSGKWASFSLIIKNPGKDNIRSIWKRIYTEWFPNSGYDHEDRPRQERCYWREDGKMVVEAWVPIKNNS